jgi:hypothetical protein
VKARKRNPVTVSRMLVWCGVLSLFAGAQEGDTDSLTPDTLGAALITTDSTGLPLPGATDSVSLPSPPADGTAGAATKPSPVVTPEKKAEGIKLVKRSYNGRRQVVLATGMMIFVVAIMTAAQQWNPR